MLSRRLAVLSVLSVCSLIAGWALVVFSLTAGCTRAGYSPAADPPADATIDAETRVDATMDAEALADAAADTGPAAAGTLDPSFGSDGSITLDFFHSQNVYWTSNALVALPNGKLLVGGSATPGPNEFSDFMVLRLNEDGSLDPSFGTEGTALIDLGRAEHLASLVLQDDGKILCGGHSSMNSDASRDKAVARLLANGIPDTSFGTNGGTVKDFNGYGESGNQLAIQKDGKILLGGQAQDGTPAGADIQVARFTADGQVDRSFGTDGVAVLDAFGWDDFGVLPTVLPDNSILVASSSYNLASRFDMTISKFNVNGVLDTSFGTAGRAWINFGFEDDWVYSLVVLQDQKILLAGCTFNGTDMDVALARFLPDGQIDTDFGLDGKVVTDIDAEEQCAHHLVVQPDGRLVIAGRTTLNGQGAFLAMRYHPDGVVDTTFGSKGIFVHDFGPGDDFGYAATILEEAGQLVVYGAVSDGTDIDIGLLRLFL